MKDKLFFTAVTSSVLALIWYLFFHSLPFNINTTKSDNRIFMMKIIPEGWEFFTRSPREEMVDLYKLNGDEWQHVDIKNNQAANFFGLSRKSRKIGMEISIMLSKIQHDSLWNEYKGMENIMFPETFNPIDNKEIATLPTGKYALLKYEMVPWSWRDKVAKKHINYEIIGILCGD